MGLAAVAVHCAPLQLEASVLMELSATGEHLAMLSIKGMIKMSHTIIVHFFVE